MRDDREGTPLEGRLSHSKLRGLRGRFSGARVRDIEAQIGGCDGFG
jgi:hypothetical protein